MLTKQYNLTVVKKRCPQLEGNCRSGTALATGQHCGHEAQRCQQTKRNWTKTAYCTH